MNTINLKTLSLSALLTSSMLSGAFAMEGSEMKNSEIDRSLTPKAKNLIEKFESPVKTDTKDVKINFKKDLEKAQGGGTQYLQNRTKMKEDAEVQAQSVNEKIKTLTDKIPEQEQELKDLQAQIKNLESETQTFNNNVLISKNGYLNLYTYNNPVTTFYSWMYSSSEAPTDLNAGPVPIEVKNEDLSEQSKQVNSLILQEKSTNAENQTFLEDELALLKEQEESKFLALQKQVEALEKNIVAAREEFEKKTAEREQAERQFKTDKENALLTRDMLPSLSPTKWLNSSPK